MSCSSSMRAMIFSWPPQRVQLSISTPSRSAAWDPPALSFVALNGQDPVMALDRNGQPMVVWPAFSDSRGNVGVYASRYH